MAKIKRTEAENKLVEIAKAIRVLDSNGHVLCQIDGPEAARISSAIESLLSEVRRSKPWDIILDDDELVNQALMGMIEEIRAELENKAPGQAGPRPGQSPQGRSS